MGLVPLRNRGGIAIVIVESTLCGLAIVAVILRIWARRLKGIRLNASDWVCIASLFVCFGLMAGSIYNVTAGLGLPISIPKPAQHPSTNQTGTLQHGDFVAPTLSYQSILIGIYFWTTSTSLIRISASLLFRKVFPVRRFVVICWIFIAVNIAYMLATYVATLLLCLPWQHDWLHTLPPPHCKQNRQRMFLGHGIINLIFDVVVVAMPMPLVWKLKLPMRRKMELILVFAVGLGVCVVTLTRTIEIELESIEQLTENYVSVAILTVIEPFLGILTCSLPVLRPVAQKIAGTLRTGHDSHFPNDSETSHVKTIGTRGKVLKNTDLYAVPDPEDVHEAKFPDTARDCESGKMSLDLALPLMLNKRSDSHIWNLSISHAL